jgi:hypothetical protein
VESPLLSRRLLGCLTVLAACLVLWAMSAASPASAPLALVFVGLTFAWHITRPDPRATAGQPSGCDGCAAGCVRCRERIDVRP